MVGQSLETYENRSLYDDKKIEKNIMRQDLRTLVRIVIEHV